MSGTPREIKCLINMKPKKPTELTTQESQPVAIQGEAERLIAQAIDKSVPVETMEKLLAMRRELKAEHAKEAFDKAMAQFQSQCPTIEKTKQGFNYKYADLTAIVEQVKSLLSENGFSYTFDTDEVDDAVVISCKVKHIEGHIEISKSTIRRETTTKMNASQQSGAAMTYGKRYAFVNAFGILTGDEDTDANTHNEKPLTARQMAQQKENQTIEGDYTTEPNNGQGQVTTKQEEFIRKLLEQKGYTEKELLGKYEITKLSQLSKDQASTIIANLMKLDPKKKTVAQQKTEEEDYIHTPLDQDGKVDTSMTDEDLNEIDNGIEEQALTH